MKKDFNNDNSKKLIIGVSILFCTVILIIGATNMFNSLDPAVKDRVKFSAYIGLPNESEIKKLLFFI